MFWDCTCCKQAKKILKHTHTHTLNTLAKELTAIIRVMQSSSSELSSPVSSNATYKKKLKIINNML